MGETRDDTGEQGSLTVLGAADAIAQLDEPAKGEPAEESEPKAEEPAKGEGEEEQQEPKPEGEGEEAAEEPAKGEGEEEAAPTVRRADDADTVEIDGKSLTIAELKRGHMRQDDYTRKSQKNADERRQIEADRMSVSKARDEHIEGLKRVEVALEEMFPQRPDFDRIRREDGEQAYATAVADWQLVQEQKDKVKARRESYEAEQTAERKAHRDLRIREEHDRLHEVMPHLHTPDGQRALLSYGEEAGFTREEIGGTVDHRLLVLLEKARRFDAIEAEKKKVIDKKAPTAPASKKVLTPGATTPPAKGAAKQKAIEEAEKRAAKSGSLKDAAAVIALMDG